ncbi:MAG: TetR/AcrR family transcriptional regulator [Bacteroidales bacterium]|nr:TetR/AcrR family transcriptional regulator [Bacteroidales bacterium]
MEKDRSTEEKIKQAARKIFHQKGYAAARTRDIAEEAGINLALLNYYFRSKEKLFEMVMAESLKEMLHPVMVILNDPATSLSSKIDQVMDAYVDILSGNPNLPIFILGEMKAHPERLPQRMGLENSFMKQTVFYFQLDSHLKKINLDEADPMQYMVNMLSLIVFPFVASPLLRTIGGLSDDDFQQMVEERRVCVPVWVKNMIQLTD